MSGKHAKSFYVTYRRLPCQTQVYYRTAKRAPGVMNLKLPHKQMHYRQISFLNSLKVKTTTKVIKDMVAGHYKPMLYSLKTLLGGVNLVGLSL